MKFNISGKSKRTTLLITEEKGFVLVTSVIILLMLTLLGIWGLTTSTFELQITGNLQRYQKKFNIAEGSANVEATLVGFNARQAYRINDPMDFFKELTSAAGASFSDPGTWPIGDIADPLGSPATPKIPYSYFVTYLYPDAPPKGYSPNEASAYKFRINGRRDIIIELGGMKIGVPL